MYSLRKLVFVNKFDTDNYAYLSTDKYSPSVNWHNLYA